MQLIVLVVVVVAVVVTAAMAACIAANAAAAVAMHAVIVIIVVIVRINDGSHNIRRRQHDRYMIIFTLLTSALTVGMIATHSHTLITYFYLVIFS